MNKPNLSHIYRNGTRNAAADALDAEAIAWLAGGSATDAQLDRIASSALHADLIHFARDLENESITLSESVNGLLRADGAAHRRANPLRRSASGRRAGGSRRQSPRVWSPPSCSGTPARCVRRRPHQW